MKKTIIALSLAAMSLPALAQQKAPEPDFTISGNFGLVSDYRFRGISQSNLKPAVQGGIDFAHKSGFYLGNWNSSVSEWTAPNGGGIEMDFYGGFKTEVAGIGLDFGTIYYYYPGAKNTGLTAPGDPKKNYWNTHEAYIGLSYGPFSFKSSYTLSDRYFSLGRSAELAGVWSSTSFTGEAKGTMYYDLGFAYEIAPKLTVKLHAGYLDVKNAANYDIKDYSVGLSYDLGDGWAVGITGYKLSLDSQIKSDAVFAEAGGGVLSKSGGALSLTKAF